MRDNGKSMVKKINMQDKKISQCEYFLLRKCDKLTVNSKSNKMHDAEKHISGLWQHVASSAIFHEATESKSIIYVHIKTKVSSSFFSY